MTANMIRIFVLCACVTVISCQTDYFWHLTDIHYDPGYWTFPKPCDENLEQGNTRVLGCQTPWELVESSIQAMFNNGRLPQFIIWTGDTNPHPGKTTQMSTEMILENLRNTTELLKYHFPDVKVYVTLGNHDYYPDGQLPGDTNPLYEGAADLWQDWINTEDAQETFKNGGYYTVPMDTHSDQLRAIILNTNLYSPDNQATIGQSDPAGQYVWLEETLLDARLTGHKVHILMHIPTGVLELPGSITWMRKADNQRLSELFTQYGDVIIAIYSGHSHFDSFRLFYEDDEPKAAMLIAPALTSWSPANQRPTNLAIRRITYDRWAHHLVDVEVFFLDIPGHLENELINWVRLYGFRAAYGVHNVTVPTLHALLEDFKKYASENFHRYEEFNAVRLDRLHPQNPPCSCRCKLTHLCAIQFVDFEENADCLESDYCDPGGAHMMIPAMWMAPLCLILSVLNKYL